MIYLAAPYSHDDPSVRQSRRYAAARAAGQIMDAGRLVYSPLSHSWGVLHASPAIINERTWLRHGLDMVRRCDAVVVLQIDGWRESEGVTVEVETARQNGKTVVFADPNNLIEAIEEAGL